MVPTAEAIESSDLGMAFEFGAVKTPEISVMRIADLINIIVIGIEA